MSDVAVAPAPAAPSTPAPSPQGEVAITEQTPRSTPIGAQTPDKPVNDTPPQRAFNRRESIERAYQRATANVKPAEAKMGHNQPPEETKVERTREKPEPIDLRKRPTDQPQQREGEQPRARAEHGHFAPRETVEQSKPQMRQVAPLPHQAPYREPPPRMGDHAKVEWHETPESVRGEVHRMHQEFDRAYQHFRRDYDTMQTIRPFEQLAQQHGTTLQRALTNYVSMENKLRNDPVGGLDVIINNLNLQTPQGQKLTLRDIAWHIVNQTPEQAQLLRAQNQHVAQQHQMRQLQAQLAHMQQQQQLAQYREQFVHTRGAIDRYAETHPRVDELGEIIENEIKLGFDLDTAYRRAELLSRSGNPAPQTRTQAAQTRTHTAQTRNPDRSISGAPGSSNGSARPREKVGRRDALSNAIKRVGGAL